MVPEPVEGPSTSAGDTATAPLIGTEPSGVSADPADSTTPTFAAAVAPTLSAGTAVLSIQRRLTAVPNVIPRTAGFPPPPTVTLPVVARSAAEFPAVVARTPTTPSSPPTPGAAAASADEPPATASVEAAQPAVDLDTTPVLAEAGPITVLPDPASPTAEPATEAAPLAYDAGPVGLPPAEHPAPAPTSNTGNFGEYSATVSPVHPRHRQWTQNT